MSFAFDAKKELCNIVRDSTCYMMAEVYGILVFAKTFSRSSICLATENKYVSNRLAELVAQTTGSIVDIVSTLTRKGGRNNLFTITIPSDEDRYNILSQFGYSGNEVSLRINMANLEDEECTKAFLAGAFLSCGVLADPNSEYRMEFIVPYMNLAKDLAYVISESGGFKIKPSIINRKGYFVVYIKGGEVITDLLAYIGASKSAMEMMQVKMIKEVRNYVNRTTNFETANISKTVTASAAQIDAINKIDRIKGINWLPEDLKEIAQIRLHNPDMSLRELCEELSKPMSRSGVNHRIRRIIDIADDLDEN